MPMHWGPICFISLKLIWCCGMEYLIYWLFGGINLVKRLSTVWNLAPSCLMWLVGEWNSHTIEAVEVLEV